MKKYVFFALVLMGMAGCSSVHEDVLGTSQTQKEMKNDHSRSFNTTDKDGVLRGVILTMQDLGFVVEKADETLGVISGTSYIYGGSKVTITVRPVGHQMIVRMGAQEDLAPIKETAAYQNFFNALEKTLMLKAYKAP